MPVTATPTTVSSSTTGCAAQTTVSPADYVLYDIPITSKMRGVALKQGQSATLEVRLYDRIGNAIDLTTCGITNTTVASTAVRVRLREGTGVDKCVTEINASTPDAAAGTVRVDLTTFSATSQAGVYLCEIGVYGSGSQMLYSDTIYVFMERGLFGADNESGGPPTLHEIRLWFSDHAESNRLIDTNVFDVADICGALVTTVQEWNASQPYIGIFMTTVSMPADWTAQWIWGIKAHLYQVAAGYAAINSLNYSAAGVQVGDLDRQAVYQNLSDRHRQMWTDWVRRVKTAINIDNCYGTFGSPYR